MQWTCVQLSGESSGLLEKEVVLATSATPCAKVARGQTGLQKAVGQLTQSHVGAKPSIKPLQIRDEFLITPRKNPPLSIQQQGLFASIEARPVLRVRSVSHDLTVVDGLAFKLLPPTYSKHR